MTKPFHAGQAARNGLCSAMLAADGFTASERVLDEGRGFFEAFFGESDVDRSAVTADLGARFWIESPGVGVKMQPAGYYMLSTFEAALKIVTDRDLLPDDVAAVEIGIRPRSRFDRAEITSGLEGKFSLQYVATMAIVQRGLEPASFSDDLARSKVVQATMAKIRTRVDETLPPDLASSYNPVTITCTDGRTYTEAVRRTRSHWEHPLSREEWAGKFHKNASGVLGDEVAARIRDTFEHLEEVEGMRDMAALLARP